MPVLPKSAHPWQSAAGLPRLSSPTFPYTLSTYFTVICDYTKLLSHSWAKQSFLGLCLNAVAHCNVICQLAPLTWLLLLPYNKFHITFKLCSFLSSDTQPSPMVLFMLLPLPGMPFVSPFSMNPNHSYPSMTSSNPRIFLVLLIYTGSSTSFLKSHFTSWHPTEPLIMTLFIPFSKHFSAWYLLLHKTPTSQLG